MRIARVCLQNWKNFTCLDVSMTDRTFLVGPNASGKSNFLDAIRFMMDVVRPGGGLERALQTRGGLSRLRSLAARRNPKVQMEFHLEDVDGPPWVYSLSLRHEGRGLHRPLVATERVTRDGTVLLDRPDDEDFFGFHFLERIAVPQLTNLTDTRDDRGVPHLQALYEHWRPNAGKQQEDQFSDGTIRLTGLPWMILESNTVLLLEEPELSLHPAIVRRLPSLFHRLVSRKKQKQRTQVIVSTHSLDLPADPGIGGEEILLFRPYGEGTSVETASERAEIRALLEEGVAAAEAVLPYTEPDLIEKLNRFPQ